MKKTVFTIFVLISTFVLAQEKEKEVNRKAATASNNLIYEANEKLADDNFVEAEADYRRAISKSSENAVAKYNLGNAYYKENSMSEAFTRFKEAGADSDSKAAKHKAYHNMGNVFMNNKEYQKAVESYKEALRNDPSDEETRYNLALAKEMLKKEQQQNQNDQKNDDKNKDQDQKDNKDQQNQDQQDQNQDQNQDQKKDQGDKGEEKQDQQDKGQQGDQQKDQQDKEDKGQPEEEKEGQQPRPSQLSPQQVKNILEAMNNEEKKVQEKINAKKVQGKPVKTAKDW